MNAGSIHAALLIHLTVPSIPVPVPVSVPAVQPDGMILVAGMSQYQASRAAWEWFIARFDPDGNPDPDFGSSLPSVGGVGEPRSDGTGGISYQRATPPGTQPPPRPAVVVRSVATGEEREMHPALEFFSVARSAPDGRALVGSGSDAAENRGVFAVDVETGRATLVMREPDTTGLGEQLASGVSLGPFTADRRGLLLGRGGVGIVKRGWPTGGETVVASIPEAGAMVLGFAASPDGESAAYGVGYLKDPAAKPEIRITSLTSGRTKVVYKGGAFELFSSSQAILTPLAWTADVSANSIASVSLHPDGHQIVYTTFASKLEL